MKQKNDSPVYRPLVTKDREMKRRRQIPAQLLLATIIALGTGIVGYFLAEMTGVLAIPAIVGKSLPADRFVVGYTEDSQPVLGSWQAKSADEATLTYFDLAGAPLGDAQWSSAIKVPAVTARPRRWADRIIFLEHQGHQQNFEGLWYLDSGDSAEPGAAFSAWSRESAQPVGYLGTAGFRAQPLAPDERFADVLDVGYYWPHGMTLLLTETQVFLVDLGRRKTHLLFDKLATPPRLLSKSAGMPSLDGPYPWGFGMVSFPGGGHQSKAGVFTGDAVTLIDFGTPNPFEEPKITMRSFPLPDEARGRTFSYADGEKGTLTVAVTDPPAFNATTQRQRIYQVPEGKTATAPRELELPRFPGEERSVFAMGLLPLASPVLEAVQAVALGQHSWHDFAGMNGPADYALALWWRDRWLLGLTGAVASALAAICFRRQVRFQVSPVERVVWPLLVFLLGLPGWIGYRYCRRWPPVEFCESCHRPAPRNVETCAVCRHGFPLPVATGSEIFA